MENLPEDLALRILSRLDDSADVARCSLAWKRFHKVSPGLRSINLTWGLQRYLESRSRVPTTPDSSPTLQRIFLNLVSNLSDLESVRISVENPPLNANVQDDGDDLHLTDGGFVKEWLFKVSKTLKSLSITDFWVPSSWRRSDVLPLISTCCHNLLKLELKNAWLSVENMIPMPLMTSLTLELIRLDDKNLTELNKCFPNLQVLNLIDVRGLKLPMIHLLNLKTCHWTTTDSPPYISLIAPNLITLRLECKTPAALYVEAPMLEHFHLAIDHMNAYAMKRFENLKTIRIECPNIKSLLNKIPKVEFETVETLTLDLRDLCREGDVSSYFTLYKLFSIFENMTSLCFNSWAWSHFSVWNDNGFNGLKTFRGYLLTVDLSLTFSKVACVLDHCFNLADVSLLIHRDVDPQESKRFITKCMNRRDDVKWRWGIWGEGMEDAWMTEEQLPKKRSRRKNQISYQKKQKH